MGAVHAANLGHLRFRVFFAYACLMGLNIGGYQDQPDWPKMGPSLLIATCLILAIRTARWSVRAGGTTASEMDLEREIEHAAHLAGRVLPPTSPLLIALIDNCANTAWQTGNLIPCYGAGDSLLCTAPFGESKEGK